MGFQMRDLMKDDNFDQLLTSPKKHARISKMWLKQTGVIYITKSALS